MTVQPRPAERATGRSVCDSRAVLQDARVSPAGDRGSITCALDEAHCPPRNESRIRSRAGVTPAVATSSVLKPKYPHTHTHLGKLGAATSQAATNSPMCPHTTEGTLISLTKKKGASSRKCHEMCKFYYLPRQDISHPSKRMARRPSDANSSPVVNPVRETAQPPGEES